MVTINLIKIALPCVQENVRHEKKKEKIGGEKESL
jgi:hypothetical protein